MGLSDSDSEGGHPLDVVIKRAKKKARVEVAHNVLPQSEPEVQEQQPLDEEHDEFIAVADSQSGEGGDGEALHSDAEYGESPGLESESNAEERQEQSGTAKQNKTAADTSKPAVTPVSADIAARLAKAAAEAKPRGVILVQDVEEITRDFEAAKVMKWNRYFEDKAAYGTGMRCFNCGQSGHMSRDCTNEARKVPCYICAQFGHEGPQCPNVLCHRCAQPGHVIKDCPERTNEKSISKVCLRCGDLSCANAGKGDYHRYQGGCSGKYAKDDLAKCRCPACGQRGHLLCISPPKEAPTISCYNCGKTGHLGGNCPDGLRPHLAAELKGDESRVRQEMMEATRLYEKYGNPQGGGRGDFGGGGRNGFYNDQHYGRGGGNNREYTGAYQYQQAQNYGQQYGQHGYGYQQSSVVQQQYNMAPPVGQYGQQYGGFARSYSQGGYNAYPAQYGGQQQYAYQQTAQVDSRRSQSADRAVHHKRGRQDDAYDYRRKSSRY